MKKASLLMSAILLCAPATAFAKSDFSNGSNFWQQSLNQATTNQTSTSQASSTTSISGSSNTAAPAGTSSTTGLSYIPHRTTMVSKMRFSM